MKVKLNPYIKTGKTLKQVIKNNSRKAVPESASDVFVSSTAKREKVKKINSYEYAPFSDILANYSEYGFASQKELKVLGKYCLERGLVYIPALALVLKMYAELSDGSGTDVDYCVDVGERNFINYMDAVKSNGKFDADKIAIAQKVKKPFDFLKLESNFDEVNLRKKDYHIINEALENGADVYFLIYSLHTLNQNKKPYKNIIEMLRLDKELKEINPACDYMDFIAINCYESPEAAKIFYTPEVVSAINYVSKPTFYPDNVKTAQVVKEKLLSLQEEFIAAGAGNQEAYITVTTSKDKNKHCLIGVKHANSHSSFLAYEYDREGQMLSISEYDFGKVTGNSRNAVINFKDLITNTEVDRKFDTKGQYSDFVKEQIIKRKSPDGKLIRTEYYKLSQLPGMYDIFYAYPDGHIEIVSRGVKDPLTGEILKKIHVTTANDFESDMLYKEDIAGNSTYEYNIADADGVCLLSRNLIKKVVDDNHIVSVIDGKEYDVTFADNKIVVTEPAGGNKQGKKFYLNVQSNTTDGVSKYKRPVVIGNNNTFGTLKQISAEFLINLIKNKSVIKDTNKEKTCYMPVENNIYFNSEEHGGFALVHEGVHANDVEMLGKTLKYNYSTDKSFRKMMNKELELARQSEPSLCINRDMNYYFSIENKNRGECEFFADSASLMYMAPDTYSVGLRVFNLIKNFPETMALVTRLFIPFTKP